MGSFMMKNLRYMLLLLLLSCSAEGKSILVIGDSISAAYGIDVKEGWVMLLQQKLAAENRSYTVINASISGDTSAGGVARIDKLLAVHRPDIIIVELGANDGLRGLPPKSLRFNLAEIVKRAQRSGAKVLLLSMRIPPNYGKRYTEAFYAVYPDVARQCRIPWAPFILEDVALRKQLMQDDGLHPNAAAQPLIVAKIWEPLKTLLVRDK
jgi:acyl-CoA thioesterase-1